MTEQGVRAGDGRGAALAAHGAATGSWYEAAEEPELVEFGPVHGLAVSGQGEPGGAAYGTSVHALYAVAGALLGMSGQESGGGFPMPPLEGRWWVEDERSPFDVPREEWRWHLFLRLADELDAVRWADRAREAARAQTPAVARVQLVTFTEGRCVQMLHRGPYADEPRSLARMTELMDAERLTVNGLHHEIYLTDPRDDERAAQTILRQPVRAV